MYIQELQERVQDTHRAWSFEDFAKFGIDFMEAIKEEKITTIVSPSDPKYVFYQFGSSYKYAISRPLNTDLFGTNPTDLRESLSAFDGILNLIKDKREESEARIKLDGMDSDLINSVIYTLQQSVGVIGDTLSNSNQSRKLIGQLFEKLVRETLSRVGIKTESRDISVQIPGSSKRMKFQLDFVFTKNVAILTGETKNISKIENQGDEEYIGRNEIVGSVKTTSKDRIDKLFLDKYMLSKLTGRDIPVAAIFLHDVQRAKKGNNDFGINSTFKSGHFIGYSLALNKLDGVYYVDPRPVMREDSELRDKIKKFSDFLVSDVWII
jgi:hypothetical protein